MVVELPYIDVTSELFPVVNVWVWFDTSDVEPVQDFDASNDLLKLIETDIKNEKIREEVKKNMEEISKKYSDLIKRIELSKENENE